MYRLVYSHVSGIAVLYSIMLATMSVLGSFSVTTLANKQWLGLLKNQALLILYHLVANELLMLPTLH